MKWYYQLLIGILIVGIIAGLAYREKLIRQYPSYVRHYQKIMKKISSQEYITELLNKYPELTVKYKDRRGYEWRSYMDYLAILDWLHTKLNYTKDPYIERHEDPIEILSHKQPERIKDSGQWIKTGKNGTFGRCGEFAIAYTALCLACDWNARIILDTSSGEGNGDHMWTEIKITYYYTVDEEKYSIDEWIHIDPTEKRVNDPHIYSRPRSEGGWGKELTEVWAIESYLAERVEENYQYQPLPQGSEPLPKE